MEVTMINAADLPSITAPCVGITRKGDEVLLLPNSDGDPEFVESFPWVYYSPDFSVSTEVTEQGWTSNVVNEHDIVSTRPATASDFAKNLMAVIKEYANFTSDDGTDR